MYHHPYCKSIEVWAATIMIIANNNDSSLFYHPSVLIQYHQYYSVIITIISINIYAVWKSWSWWRTSLIMEIQGNHLFYCKNVLCTSVWIDNKLFLFLFLNSILISCSASSDWLSKNFLIGVPVLPDRCQRVLNTLRSCQECTVKLLKTFARWLPHSHATKQAFLNTCEEVKTKDKF